MDDNSSLAESILEQIADAVIYADDTGTIMRWNHAAAALFGYSAAEALGQKLDLIIPPDLRDTHWRAFEAASGRGALALAGRPTLTRARHQSGRKLYIEMSFGLVKCFGGIAKCGAVAVARDASAKAVAPPQRSTGNGRKNGGGNGSENS